MHITEKITMALDGYMEKNGLSTLKLSEANEHLSSVGLLPNPGISGTELRRLCRHGFIHTARQLNGRGSSWTISHSGKKTFPLSDKINKIITEGRGEREIAQSIAKHPYLLRWATCRTGGHGTWILKEFPLSSKYVIDFVVITCYSGKWEIHMVEFEPIDDEGITKKGTPTARLAGAISQINDWKEYILQNPGHFRQVLAEWCIKKDILKVSHGFKTPVNGTGQYLKDIDTYLDIDYHIVIGNRNIITDERRGKINQLQFSDYSTEIFTYSRFFDIAFNHDQYHNGVQGLNMTTSEER